MRPRMREREAPGRADIVPLPLVFRDLREPLNLQPREFCRLGAEASQKP